MSKTSEASPPQQCRTWPDPRGAPRRRARPHSNFVEIAMRKFVIEIRGTRRFMRIVRCFPSAAAALDSTFSIARLGETVKVRPV